MVMGRCYRASGNPVFNKPVDEARSEKEEDDPSPADMAKIKGCDLTYAICAYSGVTVPDLHRTSLI